MKRIEVQNFQNLRIENATSRNHPLTQAKDEEEDLLTIAFIRDPYAYFDYLLFDYVQHKRSILFTQDIIQNITKLDNKAFLTWFDRLNFIPFYDPQTFQLDISKRSLTAIENLESFDYVVPYEEIDIFLENVSFDINIYKEEETQSLFSLSTQCDHDIISKFIAKDLKLYERSLELWALVKQNDFKPLRSLIDRKKSLGTTRTEVGSHQLENYKGIVGQITSNSIIGWVFHKDKEESVTVEIYKNDTLLSTVKADKMRADLKKREIHPTGQCGFEAIFNEATFQNGDKIEVKILPDEILLPFGKNVQAFLVE